MGGMRTGLRHRLQRALRRMEEQHRHLGEVQNELSRALAVGNGADAARWVGTMREALLAHFELEEQVVFPALHGLEPGLQQELAQLERDHATFLEILDLLVAAGETRPTPELTALREGLARHERVEERLMARGLAAAG